MLNTVQWTGELVLKQKTNPVLIYCVSSNKASVVCVGRGLIRWFKNKNYPTDMNNEQLLKISREFSREIRKNDHFPGKFPRKYEKLIISPGTFPWKVLNDYFLGNFPGKIEKNDHFLGNFPGRIEK